MSAFRRLILVELFLILACNGKRNSGTAISSVSDNGVNRAYAVNEYEKDYDADIGAAVVGAAMLSSSSSNNSKRGLSGKNFNLGSLMIEGTSTGFFAVPKKTANRRAAVNTNLSFVVSTDLFFSVDWIPPLAEDGSPTAERERQLIQSYIDLDPENRTMAVYPAKSIINPSNPGTINLGITMDLDKSKWGNRNSARLFVFSKGLIGTQYNMTCGIYLNRLVDPADLIKITVLENGQGQGDINDYYFKYGLFDFGVASKRFKDLASDYINNKISLKNLNGLTYLRWNLGRSILGSAPAQNFPIPVVIREWKLKKYFGSSTSPITKELLSFGMEGDFSLAVRQQYSTKLYFVIIICKKNDKIATYKDIYNIVKRNAENPPSYLAATAYKAEFQAFLNNLQQDIGIPQ